jgi:hypothetical protein
MRRPQLRGTRAYGADATASGPMAGFSERRMVRRVARTARRPSLSAPAQDTPCPRAGCCGYPRSEWSAEAHKRSLPPVSSPWSTIAYHGWKLFVRLAEPTRHFQAIIRRPPLLTGIAERLHHARQTTLHIARTHANAHWAWRYREPRRHRSRRPSGCATTTAFDDPRCPARPAP